MTCAAGTNNFKPNPFFGKIDYIRVYRGLLPVEELNNSPHNPVPGLPPPNQAPVALCRDASVDADAGCLGTIAASMLDGGSYDPDGDHLTLSIDNTGPFSAGSAGQATYPVTLTVSESQAGGLSSSCQANVTVTDTTPPGLALSDPVCSVDGRGRLATRVTAGASDACSGESAAQITGVQIVNNGGQIVRGRGVFQVDGSDLFVYPNGTGWTAVVTMTAADTRGNSATGTIRKPLPKCK
ncbi:MAG: hypothetical protein AB1806_05770 [Acidobacteriota bacterium]